MLIDGKNEVYMVDRDNSIFHVSNLEFPFRKDLRAHLTNTLLDGVRSMLCTYCNNFSSVCFVQKQGQVFRPGSVNHGISGLI